MDIDGESQDANHDKWINESGADSSLSEQPAAGSEDSKEGHGSSDSAGGMDNSNKGGSISVPAIVLAGLMLLALATAAVIAYNNKGGDSAQEEIVFEPEEVSLDEGSATLRATYSTASDAYFTSNGEDSIQLSIVKDEDTSDLYNVTGTLDSIQKVGVAGMDQGQICTVEILHEVKYSIQGNFSSSTCLFGISVTLTPSGSQLLAQGCSVDINLDPSGMYVAPRPANLVFDKSFEGIRSEVFNFYLRDVALPRGVNCPAFSQ
jgi:hypothetical protein